MSKIRIWKLGSLEHRIYASEGDIKQFKQLLEEARHQLGSSNIVWGPAVEVIEVDKDDAENIVLPSG